IASDKKSHISALDLQAHIDQTPVKLHGEVMPFADTPSFDGDIQIDDLALDRYAKLAEPTLKQLQGKLSMSGKLSLTLLPPGPPRISHRGTLNLTDYRIAYQEQTVAGNKLSWKGTASSDKSKHAVKGELVTTAFQFDHADAESRYRHDGLTWQGDLKLQSTKEADGLTSSGKLEILGLDMQAAENHFVAERVGLDVENGTASLNRERQTAQLPVKLKLVGSQLSTAQQALTSNMSNWEGSIQLDKQTDSLGFSAEGDLAQGAATLQLLNKDATIRIDNLTWQGALALTQTAGSSRFQPTGNLDISGFSAIDNGAGLTLLSLDSLSTRDVSGDSESSLTATQIDARLLRAGQTPANPTQEKQAMLTLADLKISQPQYSETRGLDIDRIEASGWQQRLIRNPDKSLNLGQLITAIRRLTTDDQATATPDKPLPIQIGRIMLSGDSQIQFEDQTTEPVYHLRLKPKQASLANITNTPKNRAGPFQLNGIVDESSVLDLKGKVALFAVEPTFELTGRIEGLELPPLSAYTLPLMGYRLQSGKANSDLHFSAKSGQIEGSSDLTLNQLEVAPVDQKKMEAMQKQLSIPLETALGMLKDKNSQIKLNLPISGAIDNIQVDPSDAINQAIGRAMKKGAKTYLATALFPFGTLLTLVELAGDAAAKIQLDPIPFAPGSSNLTANQHEYLGKIAKLLTDRPEVHIRLCGVAVASDIPVLQEAERQRLEAAAKKQEKAAKSEKTPAPDISDQQLAQLASERTKSIERYLSSQHQIKADRLITCEPRLEKTVKKDQPAPRVDLLI
ncbi:DUF748 domain-containing protein, partial [Sedimenticola sp.]|uniref:DUF748 domain-containing protein n=1 Tax=Sedimenticola sp. TaxID=1940285 RepID=UPI003D107B26